LKPNIVNAFVDVKPSIEASVDVKSGVSKLCDNQVNTAPLFSTKDRWKVQDDMIIWVCRQETKAEFTIAIEISNLQKPMLMFLCERNVEYNATKRKTKSKLEDTNLRKCECEFRLLGYLDIKTNE